MDTFRYSKPYLVEELQPLRRSLRIAMVTESYPPEVNGVANSVARLVADLRGREHSVQLVRPRPTDSEGAPVADQEDDVLTRGMAIPMYGHLRMGLPCKAGLVKHPRRTGPRPSADKRCRPFCAVPCRAAGRDHRPTVVSGAADGLAAGTLGSADHVRHHRAGSHQGNVPRRPAACRADGGLSAAARWRSAVFGSARGFARSIHIRWTKPLRGATPPQVFSQPLAGPGEARVGGTLRPARRPACRAPYRPFAAAPGPPRTTRQWRRWQYAGCRPSSR